MQNANNKDRFEILLKKQSKIMPNPMLSQLRTTLEEIENAGLYKHERLIESPQSAHISQRDENGQNRDVINLCSNNYLGLTNHPDIIAAAHTALDEHGFGMASVRFICGTHNLHRELETTIAHFLNKDDAILFAACFDANGGLFETLAGPEDAIISDSLNHASIIDGIRLSKAKRYRYDNNDMNALENALKTADKEGVRNKFIVTDGVFSMDGYIANLPDICTLAEHYDALVIVDDCHATGHLGQNGRGTPELTGVGARVDIITGTLGKTLGGAMGGFITASQPIIDLLRQRARPYLFSNALPPSIVAGSIKAIEIAETAYKERAALKANTEHFRQAMQRAGFILLPGETPIIPVMVHEAPMAQKLAKELDKRGIYVTGFFYPVVAKGKARIRTQMSSALSSTDIDKAIDAFIDAGKTIGLIS